MENRVEELQKGLLAWAGSDDGYTFLLKIAAGLIREAGHNGSLAAVWPYPLPSFADADARAAVCEEVAHDFYLFLTVSFVPRLPKNPEHVYLADSGNFRKLFEYARKKFLWQWQEKARSKELNPSGYLYRRLRETLSCDPLFETKSEGRGVFLYRLRVEPQKGRFIQTVFQVEDFSAWPILPNESVNVPEKEVFKTSYIIRAALFFWHEAGKIVPVKALAVRDLNRYIISQHPWLLTPVTVSEAVDIGREGDVEARLDAIINVKSMTILAEQLVLTWSLECCRVFLLRLQEPPVKFQAIADVFGWHDHNKAHRLFVSCRESLIAFSSNWPGPPLSELPEVCGELFLQQVKKNAKNRLTVRDKQ